MVGSNVVKAVISDQNTAMPSAVRKAAVIVLDGLFIVVPLITGGGASRVRREVGRTESQQAPPPRGDVTKKKPSGAEG